MFRFEDVKISRVVEAGTKVDCLVDRYAVCKVIKQFAVDSTVFEAGDTVICTYDIGDKIEVAYFGDFQKTKMSDFLTEDTLTPYHKHNITCDSMGAFRELFEPLDNETEAFETFLRGVKKHREELSEARFPLDKAEAHYDKIATVRQCLTALAMLSAAIAGAAAIWNFAPNPSETEHIYETVFLIVVCLIIGIMGFAGLILGLLLDAEDHLDCFTVRHQPMVESAEKLYDAEVKNHSLELADLRTRLLC